MKNIGLNAITYVIHTITLVDTTGIWDTVIGEIILHVAKIPESSLSTTTSHFLLDVIPLGNKFWSVLVVCRIVPCQNFGIRIIYFSIKSSNGTSEVQSEENSR